MRSRPHVDENFNGKIPPSEDIGKLNVQLKMKRNQAQNINHLQHWGLPHHLCHQTILVVKSGT